MKKNTKSLSILILSFPFLMANSPVPACYPNYYYDIDVNYIGYETAEEGRTGYRNTAHLKNVGEGYLTSYGISVGKKQKDSSIGYGSFPENDGSPFEEIVYGPGSEFDFTFYSDNIIPNPSKLVYTCRAYSNIDKNAQVEGDLSVEFYNQYHGSGDYIENTYQINASLNGINDRYYYGVIFDLNYKGTSYYVFTQNYRFYFYTHEDIDLNQLTISVKDVVKYDWDEEYGLFSGCNSDLNSLLGGFLIVLLVMSAIIFLSIFLPITLTRAARKRRQRAREAAVNEKKD